MVLDELQGMIAERGAHNTLAYHLRNSFLPAVPARMLEPCKRAIVAVLVGEPKIHIEIHMNPLIPGRIEAIHLVKYLSLEVFLCEVVLNEFVPSDPIADEPPAGFILQMRAA